MARAWPLWFGLGLVCPAVLATGSTLTRELELALYRTLTTELVNCPVMCALWCQRALGCPVCDQTQSLSLQWAKMEHSCNFYEELLQALETPPLTPLEEESGLATVIANTNEKELYDILSLLLPSPPPTPEVEQVMACQYSDSESPEALSDEILKGLFSNKPAPAPLEEGTEVPQTQLQTHMPRSRLKRKIRRLWNHLFEFHRRKGTHTGKFMCKSISPVNVFYGLGLVC